MSEPTPDRLPWPLPGHRDLRDRLLTAYRSRSGYHDERHLAEVLDRLGELGAAAEVPVVLAAWFHDAVYDGAADDEERSARLAEESLRGTAVDVAEVARLVRLTRSHRPRPGDTAGARLCDADLGVLATPPARYREYVEGVRADFAHVTDEEFRAGRLAVLRELAGRERLFLTSYGQHAWEPAARANLAQEIADLSTPGSH